MQRTSSMRRKTSLWSACKRLASTLLPFTPGVTFQFPTVRRQIEQIDSQPPQSVCSTPVLLAQPASYNSNAHHSARFGWFSCLEFPSPSIALARHRHATAYSADGCELEVCCKRGHQLCLARGCTQGGAGLQVIRCHHGCHSVI